MDSRLGDAGPDQAADQRVRTRRRDAQSLRNDLPDDGAGQRAEDDVRIDDIRLNNAAANCFGDMQPKEHEGDEIEKCRPEDRILRAQHARRYDGRDRIGGIVHAVEEVERKRDDDQSDQEW